MKKRVKNICRLFGKSVKSMRHQLGISQEELGFRSGLHRTYIADIENGRRNPSLESIYAISKGLGIRISNLFDNAES